MSEIVTPKGLKIELSSMIEGDVKLKSITEGVKITQVSSNASSVFINCVLLEYDNQLLIYQKRLFSKKCNLRFYIKLTNQDEAFILNLKKSFFKSYLAFSIHKNDFHFNLKNDDYHYKIQLPKSSWLTGGQYLKFTLSNKILNY